MTNRATDTRVAPNVEGPPAGYFLVVPPAADDEADGDAIDLVKIRQFLRVYWKWLFGATFLGGLIASGIALSLPNVYRARAIVAPTAESQNGSGGGLKNELGGIAELAGIDIGNGGGRKVEALATLQSKGFVRDFILKYDLLPILFAERWDSNAKTWRKGAAAPTMEIAVKRFVGRRTIDENTKTGIVTMDFVWYSPPIAAKWTNDMIAMVNERMRELDVRTAESSLDYLNREMQTASTVELREAISHLIEQQENDKMLAVVQRDYAYHFIEAATAPESKSAPLRSLIAAGGAILGFMLAMAILILHRRSSRLRAS